MPNTSLLLAPVGGGLLAGSHVLITAATGRHVGVSGLAAGVTDRDAGRRTSARTFLVAMLAAGAAVACIAPEVVANESGRPLGAVFCGSMLVGWGARRANGCTTGHGISGLGRRRLRSLAAVALFCLGAACVVAIWPAGAS